MADEAAVHHAGAHKHEDVALAVPAHHEDAALVVPAHHDERRPSLLSSPFSRRELYEEDLSQQQQQHTVQYAKSNEHFTWYFAYGANMNADVLEKRRHVQPLEKIGARLPNYKLDFAHKGVAFKEPVFASVTPMKENEQVSEVHGVLYRVKAADYAKILQAEGVHSCCPHYSTVEVIVHTYDGRQIWAHVLVTLNAHHGSLPSLRYLQLLREGARANNIDKDYQDYLQNLPAFQPACCDYLGLVLTMFLAFPLLLVLFPILLAGHTGRVVLFRVFQWVNWAVFFCLCRGHTHNATPFAPRPV